MSLINNLFFLFIISLFINKIQHHNIINNNIFQKEVFSIHKETESKESIFIIVSSNTCLSCLDAMAPILKEINVIIMGKTEEQIRKLNTIYRSKYNFYYFDIEDYRRLSSINKEDLANIFFIIKVSNNDNKYKIMMHEI